MARILSLSPILFLVNVCSATAFASSVRSIIHNDAPLYALSITPKTGNERIPRILQTHVEALSTNGYVVIPNFLPRELVDELREDVLHLRSHGVFRDAKIGQDSTNELNKSIRRAETCFIGRNHRADLSPFSGKDSVRDRNGGLYDILEGVCDGLVQMCALESGEGRLEHSLTELLYAYYPPGGFYRRHRDAIPNSASVLRKFSLLLYLNPENWSPALDAGQLRIHLDGGGDDIPIGSRPNYIDVDPIGGTLVLFKSESIPHEVLENNSERVAVVGWFNRGVTPADIGKLGNEGTAQIGLLALAFSMIMTGLFSIVGQTHPL